LKNNVVILEWLRKKKFINSVIFLLLVNNMVVRAQNRIINNIDDTLEYVGPVKTKLCETFRNSKIWHVELIFTYKNERIDTVTGSTFESEKLDDRKGFEILSEFLEANELYLSFPAGSIGINRKSITRNGETYVPKKEKRFIDYLESRIK